MGTLRLFFYPKSNPRLFAAAGDFLSDQDKESDMKSIPSLDLEARMRDQELKQAFWSGVIRGVIGAAAFFAGLVTLVYYMVQLFLVLK